MIVTLLATLAAVVVLQVGVWALSVRRHDASIVDIVWGSSFALIAWVGLATGDGAAGRSLLLAALISVWGVRLSVHLARRNLPLGEDQRYVAMRRKHPDTFVTWSLTRVFLLQAAAWVVALPVTIAMGRRLTRRAHPAGVPRHRRVGRRPVLRGGGRLAARPLQGRSDESRPGDGPRPWRYTRHPNYFGDCCVWWGLFLIAAETGWALLGVVGPIVMTILLTRVSGKDLLERTIGRRRPGYAEYVQRTNGFIPGPPRRAG